jgi:RimJ/RimL family protein N-acetyltransferase
MTPIRPDDVALRPWSADDLGLLQRLLGNPRMTEHLGGPESPEKIRKRHDRYLTMTESGEMFVITLGPEGQAVGSVGYWEMADWLGDTVWETGWSVLPELQGQGVATRATVLLVARAAAQETHRSIHAFPSVDNGPSNAVCRKVGFRLLGAHDFEYPPGNPLRCNDWALDLEPTGAER